MTEEEARQVAQVLATADDGCGECAYRLAKEMGQRFPAHDWLTLVQAVGGWGPGRWADDDDG